MDDVSKGGGDLTAMFDAAQQLHEMFRSFMVGGFTEEQALSLVAKVLVEQARD